MWRNLSQGNAAASHPPALNTSLRFCGVPVLVCNVDCHFIYTHNEMLALPLPATILALSSLTPDPGSIFFFRHINLFIHNQRWAKLL